MADIRVAAAAGVGSCELPGVTVSPLVESSVMVAATMASEAVVPPPVATLASEHKEGGCVTLSRKQPVGLNKSRCSFSPTSHVGQGTESSSLCVAVADPKASALARLGLRTSNEGGECCTGCGGGGDGRVLHRLKHQGALQQLCSSCILFYNRCMYCSICFQVYKDQSELGDPASWITCCKCFRLSHIDCFQKLNPYADLSTSVCIDCSLLDADTYVSGSQTRDSLRMEGLCVDSSAEATELVDHKKLGMNCIAPAELKGPGLDSGQASCSFPKFHLKTLAAAKVVAYLSAKEAADAKARAIAMSGVAAKAAARAKSALDAAYRAGQEEAKFNAEVARHFVTVNAKHSLQSTGPNILHRRKSEKPEMRIVRNNQGGQVTRTFPAIHKRKALSAVAGTEKYAVTAGSVPKNSFKRQQTGIQFGSDEVKVQEYLYSVPEIAEQSHEELGKQVVALAGSEGLLTTSSCLDILQKSPLLLTQGSCPSSSERDLTICDPQDNVGVNWVEVPSNLICDIPSCIVTVSSSQYSNTEVPGQLFLDSEQTSPDLGQLEIVLPAMESLNGGHLEFQGIAEENARDTEIMPSDIPLDAISSRADVGSEDVSCDDIASTLLASNS